MGKGTKVFDFGRNMDKGPKLHVLEPRPIKNPCVCCGEREAKLCFKCDPAARCVVCRKPLEYDDGPRICSLVCELKLWDRRKKRSR